MQKAKTNYFCTKISLKISAAPSLSSHFTTSWISSISSSLPHLL